MEIVLRERMKNLETKTAIARVRGRNLKERAIEYFFLLNGILAILILGGIFALLFFKAYPAFQELGSSNFSAARSGTRPPFPRFNMAFFL